MTAAVEIRDVLVVAASVAFVLVLVWRFRPQLGSERDRPMPKKLVRELEAAGDANGKAKVLFESGTQALAALRFGVAESYFRRALRLEPNSAELVERVALSLSRRPRGLEALLWRSLSEAEFQGPRRDASVVALESLVRLYERTPKQRTKATALRQMLRELEPSSPAATAPASSLDVSA